MRRLIVMMLAIWVFAPVSAQSVFSAKNLMELDEAEVAIFVMGWLAGYDQAKSISNFNREGESQALRVCMPPNTNGKIAFAVVQAHQNMLKNTQVETNTSAWAMASWLPAGMFVHAALAAYWPCKP